jgi:hypothetical protein
MEVRTGEYSGYSNSLIEPLASMKVWLWDCGPSKPVPPARPTPPSGAEGDPEADLARIEFKQHLEDYEAALKAYGRLKAEFADWELRFGGPTEQMQWSCDAADTLANDNRAVVEGRQAKQRWFLSARTRGYEKLKNGGLPEGMSAGRGHEANLERQRQGEAAFEQARRQDPVFGNAN